MHFHELVTPSLGPGELFNLQTHVKFCLLCVGICILKPTLHVNQTTGRAVGLAIIRELCLRPRLQWDYIGNYKLVEGHNKVINKRSLYFKYLPMPRYQHPSILLIYFFFSSATTWVTAGLYYQHFKKHRAPTNRPFTESFAVDSPKKVKNVAPSTIAGFLLRHHENTKDRKD